MKELNVLLEELEPVVKAAGTVIKEAKVHEVKEKSSSVDLVTEYDVMVQKMLVEWIGKIDPEASFLGEEEALEPDLSKEDIFIIDPIDGTSNFIFGYDHSCISVGLMRNKEMVLGMIYDPWDDKMYTAIKGQGAKMNAQEIHVSDRSLKDSIVNFGTSPYVAELRDRSARCMGPIIRNCMDLRRSGSAALDLCDAACGRCGVFFELKLSPWDFAAGSVIVTEAGGQITNEMGEVPCPWMPSSIVAGSKGACEELMQILRETK